MAADLPDWQTEIVIGAGATSPVVLIAQGAVAGTNPYTQRFQLDYSTYKNFRLSLFGLYMISGSTGAQPIALTYGGATSASYYYRQLTNGTLVTGPAGSANIPVIAVEGTSFQLFGGQPVRGMLELWLESGTSTMAPTARIRGNQVTAFNAGNYRLSQFITDGIYAGWNDGAGGVDWNGHNFIDLTMPAGEIGGFYELYGWV